MLNSLVVVSYLFFAPQLDQTPQERLIELSDSVNLILNSGQPLRLNKLSREGRQIAKQTGQQEKYLEFTYYYGASFFNINLDSGIYFLESGLHTALGEKDPLMQAKYLNSLGNFYRKKADFSQSLSYLMQGKKIVSIIDHPRKDMYLASFNGKLGSLYKDLGDYQKSIDLQLETLKIWEENEDRDRMAITLNDIGLLYKYLDKYDAALENFSASRAIASSGSNQSLLSKVIANVAEVFVHTENYDSALYLLKESLTIKETLNVNTVETQLAIAEVLIKVNQLDSAAVFLNNLGSKSWENVSRELKHLLLNGKLALKRGENDVAIEFGRKAQAIAREMGRGFEIVQVLEFLSQAYSQNGQGEQAYQTLKEANDISELLVNEENIRAVENSRISFETNKKEVSIQELTATNRIQELQLSRRNLLLGISIILFMSILVIGYLIYHQRLVRKRKEANDLKQKLLRVQLNPHFMFNSLNAIQNLVYTNAEKQKTADYLARFSHLTRQILELNQHDFIALEDELKFIENYLSIQQIRFDQPFRYRIVVEDELQEMSGILIPPMITQPFLENAIEHGIISKHEHGEITLLVSLDESYIHIKIEDNGVGRESAVFKKRTSKHRSMATQITLDRLDNLQRSFRRQASMKIEDIAQGQLVLGTRVLFKLPLKREE